MEALQYHKKLEELQKAFEIAKELVQQYLDEVQKQHESQDDPDNPIGVQNIEAGEAMQDFKDLVFGVCGITAIIVGHYWSCILDIVLPINESQTHSMLVTMEYFIDQDRYFFLIMLHMNLAACLATMSMLATGTTFIAYLEHTCEMFRIANYRIKRAISIVLKNNNLDEMLIFKGIICAVNIHQKAIKLVNT
nr:PREDICTED: uncharacterized protein LOC105675661 [Linepithema humile]